MKPSNGSWRFCNVSLRTFPKQFDILQNGTVTFFNHVELEGLDSYYSCCPLTNHRLEQTLAISLRSRLPMLTHLVTFLLELHYRLGVLHALDSSFHPAYQSACTTKAPVDIRSKRAFRLAFLFPSIHASLFFCSNAAFQHLSTVLCVKYECAFRAITALLSTFLDDDTHIRSDFETILDSYVRSAWRS
jgi:hypothetical protein